jgi:hypothetical protein
LLATKILKIGEILVEEILTQILLVRYLETDTLVLSPVTCHPFCFSGEKESKGFFLA